jgi:GNAT superfamily N-acetyltransferase
MGFGVGFRLENGSGGRVFQMAPSETAPEIRRAVLADAPVLAALNAQAWQETYRGLLPDQLLDDPDFAAGRERIWDEVLRYAGPDDATFLLFDEAGLPAGYAGAGPAREADMGCTMELYTIYLLRRAQGRGWGRFLWNSVRDGLGKRAFYLWSHAENPSLAFYQHMGGTPIATRLGRWGDVRFPECAYGFPA